MSDFFGNESVFKKPAVPPRYQRTNFGNNSAYIHGGINISNNSGYTASKLKEKIEILEKVFPQNDNIWENLIKNVDHLCFVKVSEQVLQPSGQQSLFNGGSTCPSVCSQIRRSNEKAKNNFTQTTNNVRDYIRSQNYQRSNLRNELSHFTLPESEQVECHPSRLHNVFPVPVVQEYELPEHIRSSKLQNPCQTSGRVNYQKSKSRDAATELDNISTFSRKPDETSCESRIVRKLNVIKSTSRQCKEKIPEDEDMADTSDLSIQNASNSHVNIPTVAKKSSKNKINESVLGVKRKHRSVELTVPAIPKKQSKKQEPAAKVQQASSAIPSNVRSSRKKNEQSVKDIRDTSDRSSISTRSSIRKNDEPYRDNRELIVLNSEDENDSLTAFFNKRRKLTAKKTTASTGTGTVPPITRVDNSSIQRGDKRKREISQSSEVESESEKDDFHSAESEVSQLEQPSEISTKKNVRTSRKAIRKNGNKNNAKDGSKNNAVSSQNKENISTEDIIDKNLVPPVKDKLKQAVDNSFFGEVSSILENEDVSLLRVDKRKGRSKRISENDTSMPFLSPFAPGNSRSTSVFSAISTPLSKSASKNVMGKRIKKPSVVAELKGELKRTRKKRDDKTKAKPIEPAMETTASTESECEVSDFSDD